jgi:hypothetical protein
MNSLPLIPHHLYIAAIRNEGRPHERPTPKERRSDAAADPVNAMVLEVTDRWQPMPPGAAYPLGVSVSPLRPRPVANIARDGIKDSDGSALIKLYC